MKKKIFYVIIFIVSINLIGCQKGVHNLIDSSTISSSSKTVAVYNNPIDAYYLPKINQSSAEVELRIYQDKYYEVWTEQFDRIIQLMKDKCIYKKDIDAIESYKASVEKLIDNSSTILVTEWLDDYKLPPDSPERGSWGNGTRSGLNMKHAEILRDACMMLIPYCDKYTYPNLK